MEKSAFIKKVIEAAALLGHDQSIGRPLSIHAAAQYARDAQLYPDEHGSNGRDPISETITNIAGATIESAKEGGLTPIAYLSLYYAVEKAWEWYQKRMEPTTSRSGH